MNQNYPHINDDLLVKHLVGETDANENDVVKNWLETDRANQKYYNDFKKIWDKSLDIAAHSTVDENAAWLRMQNRMHTEAKPVPVIQMKKASFGWMRIAASFLIISAIGYLAYTFLGNNVTQREVFATNTILTETLPDGTVVTLNKNSSLSFASKFEGTTRPVVMKGEAFFDVAPDKQKPFIIKVNDVTVQVVGTSFNVKNKNGKTTVEVETGIVKVSKESSSVELTKGEKVIIEDEHPELIKGISKGRLYNYYRNNELVCNGTPLQELVDALNEIYNVNIIIKGADLQQKPITTTFKSQSLNEILSVISDVFRIKVERKNNQIILVE